MWGVTYSHKHGVDFWYYSTKEEAELSTGEVILEWLRDVPRKKIKIELLTFLKNKEFGAARDLWCDVSGETLEIRELVEGEALDEKGLMDRVDNFLRYLNDQG